MANSYTMQAPWQQLRPTKRIREFNWLSEGLLKIEFKVISSGSEIEQVFVYWID